jgi:hypothetical protein
VLRLRLSPCFFNALLMDQTVNLGHVLAHDVIGSYRQGGVWSRRLFEGYLRLDISVCDQTPVDNPESREQTPIRARPDSTDSLWIRPLIPFPARLMDPSRPSGHRVGSLVAARGHPAMCAGGMVDGAPESAARM